MELRSPWLVVPVLALSGRLLCGGEAPELKNLPVNAWVLVEDAEDGGTDAGIVYLPEKKGMFLWGIRRRKDWRGRLLSRRYWAELFRAETGTWE